jgi:hypothetical protein
MCMYSWNKFLDNRGGEEDEMGGELTESLAG